jgi:hypothetical protein
MELATFARIFARFADKKPLLKKSSLQNSRYEIHMVVVENISTSRIVFAYNVDFLTRI